MNRHLIARKDAESWRKSRRRKDANFVSKRRARLRPLAFGLAVLMATTSPLTAFATPAPLTTTVGTPTGPSYNLNTASTQYSTVGAGGCSGNYTNSINTANTVGLSSVATGVAASVAALIATQVAQGAQAGEFTAMAVGLGLAGGGLAEAGVGVATPLDAAPAAPGLELAGGGLDDAAASAGALAGTDTAASIANISNDVSAAANVVGVASQVYAQSLLNYSTGESSLGYPGLNSCSTEFTGTITADANINASQGISADNGAIYLGNTDGKTYQPGISLGGGALAGAGSGVEAFTGDANSIAIGNGASADAAGGGTDDVAIGDKATAGTSTAADFDPPRSAPIRMQPPAVRQSAKARRHPTAAKR